MTPTERAMRDAWLAEMWAPVREYHDGDPLPKRPIRRRAPRVETVVDETRKKAS